MLTGRPAWWALLAGLSAGCMAVQPVLAPGQFISQTRPRLVYVLDRDSSLVRIEQPRLEGDSVIGLVPGYSERVGIALPEVRQVLARQPDRGRTAVLVVGVAVAAGVVGYAVLGHKGSSGSVCSNPEPPYTACY